MSSLLPGPTTRPSSCRLTPSHSLWKAATPATSSGSPATGRYSLHPAVSCRCLVNGSGTGKGDCPKAKCAMACPAACSAFTRSLKARLEAPPSPASSGRTSDPKSVPPAISPLPPVSVETAPCCRI